NFIFRTLEHINEGIVVDGGAQTLRFPNEKIFLHIILPRSFDGETSHTAREYLKRYRCGRVAARNRAAEIRFEVVGDECHIVDFPTTLVTSYDTARMILELDADDAADPMAAERFTRKELNLYEAALRQLLSAHYLSQVLSEQYPNLAREETDKIRDRVLDVLENRLTIEYFDRF
ncbi:MAG: hypothetical protein IJK98_02890, partial [Clostridia bacterium]|nr:hypothetical protein [Clostridia bacterium]